MAWTGFTDEQLAQLKNEPDEVSEEGFSKSNPPLRKTAQRGRTGGHRGGRGGNAQRGGGPRGRTAAQRGSGPKPPIPPQLQHGESLAPNQMLSRPKEVPNRPRPEQRPRPESSGHHQANQINPDHTGGGQVRNSEQSRAKTANVQSSKDSLQNRPDGPKPTGVTEKGLVESLQDEDEVENKEVVTDELDEKIGLSRELTKMQKFQAEQKNLEEGNARRKVLLGKALADRKRKTQAESKRLAYIQKEMSTIENLLTTDVRILRDKIEEASREYLEAQKRYQKAEAEFVEAKTYLHKTEDKKDALTEHLFTIIHENELRKSKKLEELVLKLDIDNIDEFERQIAAEEVERKAALPKSPEPSAKISADFSNTTTSNTTTSNTTVITDEPPSQTLSRQSEPSVVMTTVQTTENKSTNEETSSSSNGKVPSDDKQPTVIKSEQTVTSEDEVKTVNLDNKSEKTSSTIMQGTGDCDVNPVSETNCDDDMTGSVSANMTAAGNGPIHSKMDSDSTSTTPQKTEGDSSVISPDKEPPEATS